MSTRHARTADKTTNDKHTRILKALLQQPGNKYCVDCRKKDPRWASFNLGCFMCIRCSGVHRSMGTHISKVKSIDLDSWTVDQVENMIKWGNEKANMYWEARLPQNSIPNESTSGIDPWIRSKYERKQFAAKGAIPDPSELGPIDEGMMMDLYGKAEAPSRSHRSADTSGSFTGMIAPPPANPTRSSIPKKPASTGLQGADLFSIGQRPAPAAAAKPAAQHDFFGLNDPVHAPAPSSAQKAHSPQPAQAQTSASQDLFSLVSPAPSNGQAVSGATAGQAAPKAAGGADWKNSIMSLYGNQPTTPQRNSNGFNMGQQQQQQQQQQPGQFGQLQGMNAFGFSQPQQQFQPPQQQQQQQSIWGNDDGFGAMQQASAPSSSSFDAFSMGTQSGFGAQPAARPNNSNNSNGGMPQGGDFFNMIAGAARSPVTSPPAQNKNSSAFGDLTWN